MKSPMHFLFIEILDPEINAFFKMLQKEINDEVINDKIHITLMGPFSKPISRKKIKDVENELCGKPVYIKDVGIFNFDSLVFLYCNAIINDNKINKIIWDKPDLPVKEYKPKPHITIYQGKDLEYAKYLKGFLNKDYNKISLVCEKYKVVPHISRQKVLFEDFVNIDSQYISLINDGRVSPLFHDRLARSIKNYKSKSQV